MTVYHNCHTSHIRSIWQLCHFFPGSFIKRSCNECISYFSCICLLQSVADTKISVSLGKNGFTFSQISLIKSVFLNQPVFQFSGSCIVFHHIHKSAFLSSYISLLPLKPPQMPVPVPVHIHIKECLEVRQLSGQRIILCSHKRMIP